MHNMDEENVYRVKETDKRGKERERDMGMRMGGQVS